MRYVNEKDKSVLLELGKQYMEVANLPTQKEKMMLWKKFNRQENSRPMVMIDQLPWNELSISPELELHVQNPFLRGIEWELRASLYKWNHFPVDMVLEPYITIPRAITGADYGLKALKELRGEDECTAFSQHFTPVIETMDDILKIKDMNIQEDIQETQKRMQMAEEVFGTEVPYILGHGIGFHLGVWDRLSEYMSLENIYFDIYDRPEFLHACMRRITDATIAGIEQANKLQIHNDIVNQCHCSYIYTDDMLPDFGKGRGALSKNCWAMGLAQLFTAASPAITEEFEIPYVSEMAKYFGSIYYGCCERLDDRIPILLKIPNIKKLSCSPWSHKESFVEQLKGQNVIASTKPNPALVAANYNEEDIRNDIRETVRLSRENMVNTELILKDISTVFRKPERLTKWAEIAMQEVEKY